ncbi:gliding motility-associated C-terminal domain-containing protein [Catalinimonas alkaloidigena]|uniref:Gliding motility-associated C-terminal domain-containing protein n=1 Tax=Catalinimonas alkaloidigena TaxID=1075417 RepID=A0A1G9RIX0_9BACT|nr:FG-GAP-like repeat-containing protein [Catalinimonas alkaloidigena]SDM23174.1 gliding motility-associated C-terminal domain-containing protein [Catalinimonas alkaloidigena]
MKLYTTWGLALLSSAVLAQEFEVHERPAPAEGWQPRGVVFADLNSNTQLETIWYGDAAGKGLLYLGSNVHTSAPAYTTLDLGFQSIVTVTLVDADQDNEVDVLVSGKKAPSGEPASQLYLNRGNSTFEPSDWIDSLAAIQTLWADWDSDGRKDLLVYGTDADGVLALHAYRHTTDGWERQNSGLPAWLQQTMLPFDADNDGDTDVLITGRASDGTAVAQVYTNQGSFRFQAGTQLPASSVGGATAAGDYNSDGHMDLLLTGTDPTGQAQTLLYLHQGDGYQRAALELEAMVGQTALLADLDHDGSTDVLLAGTKAAGTPGWRLYAQRTEGLQAVNYDTLAQATSLVGVADLTNDGNLDLIQTGSQNDTATVHFWQSLASPNRGPHVPTDPRSVTIANRTLLSWQAPTDDTTAQEALTYEVYVGTYEEGMDIASATAHKGGLRKLVAHGSQGQGTTFTLYDLPDGVYYWGVQAVDNAFRGSECWCAEGQGGSGFCTGLFRVCTDIARADTMLCEGTALTLTTSTGGAWYSTALGFLSESATTTYTATQSDTLYYVGPPDAACQENYSLTVQLAFPDSMQLTLGADTTVCPGEVLSFSADTALGQVRWRSAAQGDLGTDTPLYYTASQRDQVWAELHTAGGCTVWSDTVTISLFETIELLSEEEVRMPEGGSVVLRTAQARTYQWSPAEGLSDPNSDSPVATPDVTTTYVVKATSLDGCALVDSITVIVEPQVTATRLFIPNYFSPNGDGRNEVFKVYGDGIDAFTLQIFDRSGVKVFETTNPSEGWAGDVNGTPQPGGVYLWRISGQFRDGSELTFNGERTGVIRLAR